MITCIDIVALPVCHVKLSASDISVTNLVSVHDYILQETSVFYVAQEVAGDTV